MPLDGYSYLVAQGWGGKGEALREGALSRPITVAHKKTLSGIGKDRDEAFPFWDHVFSAAANAIQVRIQGDSDDDIDTPRPSGSNTPLDLTSTGILSNRPQKIGTPALSEHSIPTTNTGMSVMALAKREAAKRGLYAMFFRGPLLGPSEEELVESRSECDVVGEPHISTKMPKLKKKDKRRNKEAINLDREDEKKRLRKALKKAQKLASSSQSAAMGADVVGDNTGEKIFDSVKRKRKHKERIKVSKNSRDISPYNNPLPPVGIAKESGTEKKRKREGELETAKKRKRKAHNE